MYAPFDLRLVNPFPFFSLLRLIKFNKHMDRASGFALAQAASCQSCPKMPRDGKSVLTVVPIGAQACFCG
jgi:hypothetical protein